MRAETPEVRRPGRAETRIDPALELLQDRGEEIKMSEKSECRSFKNSCCRSSPRVVALLVSTAILSLVILVLLFVLLCKSPVKEAPQQCSDTEVPAPCGPACPSGWIGYEGKCYFFSDGGRNWTSGQSFCTSHDSSLAVIENEPEKAFIMRYKCSTDHWIGLQKDAAHNWKWADGTELNGTLEVKGKGGDCAFLNSGYAVSSRCYIQRNWICSHHDAYASHKNSTRR
ncbi:PREDICTED: C-type lectin domain family 2 member D-like [Gekko japonicus]|uniref:C-type lectin domain family 2 member D-like n=1 Tax=Gekko japonicus TaxID=146911 RepID=A0ABM1KMI5_GEKJA|nr:PREDICTED: C-type lectin domain family 2 member D-like [Gekko japonicus]XP_015274921.1 PREDICTED: C-type lectin domain family 2 member D-like [Gekko japonicus]XP_015274922.1 PREDICTED: C-type lectin domain family 2 member D-like [Gekko japonicus]XP_015274924.1 PREDICTED: C-type lectin domain family 2 member D-like [Gekko japonicus]